ncbi:MAG: sulfotransferase [Aestuariibacter sp.]
MTQQFHFISGLPRSGSTLLAAILRQNPEFHAAMTSPVANLMNGLLEQMGAGSEFNAFFDDRKRKNVVRSVCDAYYADIQLHTQVIFDTNRLWTARMHQLVELFDNFKMICCVRNPAWVADSFEQIYRKNPFDYSRMFNPSTRMTVYTRCESMMAASGVVGGAWTALKEAFYGNYSDRLILLDYNILAQNPQQAMKLVYQFLDLPEYEHDFENLDYQQDAFDQQLGIKGLHKVRPKVSLETRRSILPPELFKEYQEMSFWQDLAGTKSSVIQAKSGA